MVYNADVEDAISICTDGEREIGQMIESLSGTKAGERRRLINDIELKLRKLSDDINYLLTEVDTLTDGAVKTEYKSKYQMHKESLTQLQDNFAFAGRNQAVDEASKPKVINEQKLMDDSKKLQDQQKNSLDQSLQTISNIEQVGGDTALEIKRQQDQMAKANDNLETMDSELDRGKKVIKGIVTRAAGDNCVRALAILIIIAIIGIIVLESTGLGSVKEQVDSWINFETESDPPI